MSKRKVSYFKILFLMIAVILITSIVSVSRISYTETVKITPLTLSATGRTAGANVLWNLFDNDTETAFSHVPETSRIVVALEKNYNIKTIRFFGKAAYLANVYWGSPGAWTPISGLTDVDLEKLSDGWNSFDAVDEIITGNMMFELTPLSTEVNIKGVSEVEIWGLNGKKNIPGKEALLGAAESGDMPDNVVLLKASPFEGQVVREETNDNLKFTFNNDRDPRVYKACYLLYESNGLSRWVGTRQSINGTGFTGGFWVGDSDQWTLQVEPVNPLWLRPGENSLTFSAPEDMYGSYAIRDVRFVALMDDGTSFIKEISGPGNPGTLVDEDLSTFWTFSPASGGEDIVDITFKNPIQPHSVSFFLKNSIKGKLDYHYRSAGQWAAPQGGVTNTLNTLQSGWNIIPTLIPDNGTTDGLRLIFTSAGQGGGNIHQLSISGSRAGEREAYRKLVITSPESGEFYGRKAYISGWIEGPDTVNAQIYIAGQKYVRPTGDPENHFGRAVTKDEAGFEGQEDSEPWQVEVKAVYPDGSNVKQIVKLGSYMEEEALPEKETGSASGEEEEKKINSRTIEETDEVEEEVSPGMGKKIGLKGTSLDIPGGAVWKNMKIKIKALKHADLAKLDPGMVNVTAPDYGYRFTPHGTRFRKTVKLKMPYDPYLIPAGMTENDVWTFFYDEKEKSWKKLKRADIDKNAALVESETDHFTDMINAVLVTPEHPEALTYNPNTIKDIKAADPGAGINLIEAPRANNMGDAKLNYPIEIPAGRKGMQPQLSVSYSSSGGNGWLGLGWDLQIPAITVDTRWGVPRYDSAKETETYALNGEMLTPVAHRGELKPRSGEKVFHTRVEGRFREIIRHGNSPDKYWWEVIDKNGTGHFYGGIDGNDASGKLAGDKGIYQWMIRKSIDTNGNTVIYDYSLVCDTGVGGGNNSNGDETCDSGVSGHQIYLKEISYAGFNDTPGKYIVRFVRDNELNEPRRKDISIHGKAGFKIVTADLLRRIEIVLDNQRIRNYVLDYREGVFNKTILSSISQYGEGEKGALFNKHDFDYYDEINLPEKEDPSLLDDKINIETGDDNIAVHLGGKGHEYASAMGGTHAKYNGRHRYRGVSNYLPMKSASQGKKWGTQKTNSTVYLILTDINGDGLADKVFKEGNKYYYRANNLAEDGATTFSGKVELPTLKGLGRQLTEGRSKGDEIYLFYGSFSRYNVKTTSTSMEYFADVNGDNLPDFVKNGVVWFNYLDEDRIPTFTLDSNKTKIPVKQSKIDIEGLIEDQSAFYEEQINNYPLIDPVRRWVAPYDGIVSIGGSVTLIEDTTEDRNAYQTADGVRVAIQHNGSEIWTERIEAQDYSPHNPGGAGSITVKKGDRIYFRVQSVFDGAYDRVTWDPVITYADKPQEALDADNKNIYRFKASEDFLLMGRGGSIPMPFKGKVLITGDLNKADITTDDIRVVVYKNDVPLITKSMSWNETGAVVFNDEVPIGVASTIIYDQSQLNALGIDVASRPDNISDPVDIMDSLRFEIQTDSPIDLTQITWAPVVTYIESNDTNAGSLTDEEGNYIVNMNMPFGVDMYPENGKNTASLPWQVSKEGAFIIYPRLGLITDDPDYLGPLTDVPNSEVAFTVKRRGALVGKSILNIAANKVTEPYLSSIFVPGAGADEELFLDFSSRTPELRAYVQNHAAKIFYVEPATWVSEVAETIKVTPLLKFNLKGNEEAIGSALFMIVKDGEVLHREKLDVSVDKQTPFIAGETVIDTSRGDKIEFYMIITGGNISKFLQQAAISINKNGLLYEKTIPTGAAAETFSAPFNTSIGEAGMFPVAYRGWSYAAYNGNRDRALKPINENDFNISRNNDVNSEEKAYPLIPLQKTHSWGGADEDCRLTNTTMSSTRFGTKYIDVPKSEDFNAYRAVNKIGIAEDYQEGSDTSWYYVPISSGWQSSTGDSHSLLDYMDMNGDHYPDIVSPGGIQYTRADGTLDDKRTNLARLKGIIRKSENDQFNWNIALGGSPGMFGTTSDGTPLSTGAKGGGAKGNTGGGNGGKISGKSGGTGGGGGGKSTGGWIWTAINLAVSFGIGDYSSDGESEVKYDLIDMNGDGLPDKVAQGLKVSLNLGYDFAEPEYWGGVAINESITESDSMSYGFNYMMSAFGEGTSYSDTEGEVEKTLKDINGDGLPDFLFMDGVILVDPDVICDSTNDDGNACDNTYTIYYIKAALNTGAGFGAPVKLIEEDSRISTGLRIESTEGETAGRGLYDTYAVPVINCRDGVCLILHFLIFNQGKDSSESMTKVVNTLVDINGDGLPDHLTSGKDSSMRAHINKTSRTNLLKSVTRPMGASFKIEYKRTGNTYDHPQSKWVMSRLEVSDGFNGDGVDSMVKTIRYENGKYDRLEREFYGFKHVIEEQRDASDMDSLYRSVSREYLNDNFCNKGLLKSEIVRDNLENRFMETVNSYFLYDIDTRAEVNPINIERATVFPKLVRTEKKFYEGQPHFEKETYAAFDYDDYGNVTDFFDAGEPGATDDIVVVIKYEYRPSSYLMSLPQLITVTGGDGKKYRERKGSYDSRGNVTQLVSSISDGQSATIDMTYDDYGNIKTFTGASNEKGDRYQLSYTYDSTVHSYVEKIEDSFNYISTAKYDYRYGKPLSTTDLNGNVISYSYDAFGRTKQIYGPYDQGSHVPTLSFEYHPEVVPARALTKNKEHWDSSETIDTLIYTDGLKRVLQTKKEAEVRKVYGMTISGKAIYDAFGRVIQQGQPVFEAGYQTAFNIQGEPKNPTLFEYDVLDRQTRITLPDNSFSTIVYGFEDNLFMTKVTDGEGKIKNSLKDLRDGIRTMKEKLGNGWIITKYIYNPISEIIEIIDDRDNHTYVTYDMLGRRLSIDNPDTGNVEYKYDEAGNLTGKITPNLRADSKSIKYIYDYNRLARIDYPYRADTEYTYGAANASFNRVGRVVTLVSSDVKTERFYGKLGETVKEIKAVYSHVPSKAWTEHRTEYEFDSFGRIRSLVYPDGEVLTYGYDKGGLVISATGFKGGTEYPYLKDMSYDEFGQRVEITYGNNVVTNYEYDNKTRHLSHILTTNPAGFALQNMAYTYDLVGNVLKTENGPFVISNNASLSVTQAYGYDDLHRLVSAEGRYQTGPDRIDRYTNSFTYDTIGNFTVKNQSHHDFKPSDGSMRERKETTYNFLYDYKGSQPHAPTHIGDKTYLYDDNGNMLGWDHDKSGKKRRIVWDEENWVQSVADSGSTTEFRYDADGTRVLKRGRYGEVIYVNENYAVRNGAIHTKHVFVGNTRIATKLKLQQVTRSPQKTTTIQTASTTAIATTTAPAANQSAQDSPVAQRQAQQPVVQETVQFADTLPGNGKGKGQGLAKGKVAATPPGQAAKQTSVIHQQAVSAAPTGGTTDTALPGKSEKGLENALSRGNGQKSGIYRRLSKLGYVVTPDGQIVPAGNLPPGGGGGTPPGGGNGGGNTGGGQGNNTFEEKAVYYYHTDHLGSSNIITDAAGDMYEHMEYFPYGEAWVEETKSEVYFPYKFTGKELDPETGMYYFGARYYEPRISVWVSADPILNLYLDRNGGISGVYYPINLNLYGYAGTNPVKFIDPDGQTIKLAPGLLKAQKKQVLNNLQALTGDTLFIDGNEIKIKSLGKKEAGGKGKVMGTRLIRRMRLSPKTVTIDVVSGGGNKEFDLNPTAATNGTGSDTGVYFDTTSNPPIKTLDPTTGKVSPKRGRPNSIGLGHEMVHADRSMRGKATPYSTMDTHTYTDSAGNPVTQTVPAEELATVGLKNVQAGDITENNLRKEQSIDLRGAY